MIRFKGEKGASAVEFALIVSLLFVVLFGIIQFGIAFNRYQGLNAAAREGARLGSLTGTQVDTIQDRVLNSLSILNPAAFKDSGGGRIYQCPGTLATEKGCIEVSQEDINNPGQYILMTSGSSVPCDSAHSGAKWNIKVFVKYQMRITIPLWASPTVGANGTGVFKCE